MHIVKWIRASFVILRHSWEGLNSGQKAKTSFLRSESRVKMAALLISLLISNPDRSGMDRSLFWSWWKVFSTIGRRSRRFRPYLIMTNNGRIYNNRNWLVCCLKKNIKIDFFKFSCSVCKPTDRSNQMIKSCQCHLAFHGDCLRPSIPAKTLSLMLSASKK